MSEEQIDVGLLHRLQWEDPNVSPYVRLARLLVRSAECETADADLRRLIATNEKAMSELREALSKKERVRNDAAARMVKFHRFKQGLRAEIAALEREIEEAKGQPETQEATT